MASSGNRYWERGYKEKRERQKEVKAKRKLMMRLSLMIRYAGIGSRETPKDVLETMGKISEYLESKGFILRSGNAIGADEAFEYALKDKTGKTKEIFTANSDIPTEAFELAEQFHHNWKACSDYARRLHARNGMILLGKDLDRPVDFVVCWTKDGKATGGTGQALRMVEHYQIPVFNLYFDNATEDLKNFLKLNYKVVL